MTTADVYCIQIIHIKILLSYYVVFLYEIIE